MRSFGTQTNKLSASAAYLQRNQWREKEKSVKAQNERLRLFVDSYKKKLEQLKQECRIGKFLQISEISELSSIKAKLIKDQVMNYKVKSLLGLKEQSDSALYYVTLLQYAISILDQRSCLLFSVKLHCKSTWKVV